MPGKEGREGLFGRKSGDSPLKCSFRGKESILISFSKSWFSFSTGLEFLQPGPETLACGCEAWPAPGFRSRLEIGASFPGGERAPGDATPGVERGSGWKWRRKLLKQWSPRPGMAPTIGARRWTDGPVAGEGATRTVATAPPRPACQCGRGCKGQLRPCYACGCSLRRRAARSARAHWCRECE